MYELDIQAKVTRLPEIAKGEVLDFVEFLLSKYGALPENPPRKMKNPLLEIAGFAEIGPMDSSM